MKRRSRSRRIASHPSIRSFEFRHTAVKDRCQYRRVIGIPDQTACGISLPRSIGTTVHNRAFIHTPGYGTGHRADHHARRGEHDITNIGRSNRPEQSRKLLHIRMQTGDRMAATIEQAFKLNSSCTYRNPFVIRQIDICGQTYRTILEILTCTDQIGQPG